MIFDELKKRGKITSLGNIIKQFRESLFKDPLSLQEMTITHKSKVKHIRSEKIGVVKEVEVHFVGHIRFRYIQIWWENEPKVDPNYYLVREVKELKSPESVLERERVVTNKRKEYKLDKHLKKTETDILRFLNPRIQDNELNEALDNIPVSFPSNPEFLMRPHKATSKRSERLAPGTAIVDIAEIAVESEDACEPDISDSEENNDDTDRSKLNINIDAVNYQVLDFKATSMDITYCYNMYYL